MSADIEDLLAAIESEDFSRASLAFQNAVDEKAEAALAARRVEIAGSLGSEEIDESTNPGKYKVGQTVKAKSSGREFVVKEVIPGLGKSKAGYRLIDKESDQQSPNVWPESKLTEEMDLIEGSGKYKGVSWDVKKVGNKFELTVDGNKVDKFDEEAEAKDAAKEFIDIAKDS